MNSIMALANIGSVCGNANRVGGTALRTIGMMAGVSMTSFLAGGSSGGMCCVLRNAVARFTNREGSLGACNGFNLASSSNSTCICNLATN